MAPFMPLALAAVFCAAPFMNQADADAATGEGITADCLLPLNLSRTAKLDTSVPALNNDQNTETQAIAKIATLLADSTNCATTTTPADANGLLLKTAGSAKPSAADITTLIKTAVTEGLTALGPSYVATTTFDKAKAPFDKPAAQNLAFMMDSKSTKVGCATASSCSGGNNYVYCLFEPTLSAASVPFSDDFYKALEARQKANIDLGTLTSKDLNTKLNDGGGTGAAIGAIPGAAIIFISLAGLLSSQ